MGEWLLRNLIYYSLQGFVLVGAAALFFRLSRAAHPRIAYLFWRIVLVLFLLLPLLSFLGRTGASPWLELVSIDVIRSETGPTSSLAESDGFYVFAWLVLIGGWIVGATQLFRRHRAGRQIVSSSSPYLLTLPPSLDRVRVRESLQIRSPAVWGWFRPTLLLPQDFKELRPEVRHLILSHELQHIRNQDWLWNMLEECLRVVFWFHPALLWVVSQIQRARELRADLAVIEQGATKKLYLQSLLHFARRQSEEVLQPAFLGALSFRERIRLIQQGVHMSFRTKLFFCATAIPALMVGALAASSLFPISGVSMVGQTAEAPLTVKEVDTPPKLLKQVTPVYPEKARRAGVEGVVLVELVVTTEGDVGDLEVLGGPLILRQSALDAVKQFEFEPALKDGKAVPVRAVVEMTFKLPEGDGSSGG